MQLTVEGRTLTVEEWADQYGIPASLIYSRLRKAWFPDRAITTPMQTSVAESFMRPIVAAPVAPSQRARRIVIPTTHSTFTRPTTTRRPALPKVARREGRGAAARIIEFDGITLTVPEWAARLGVQHQLICYRLRQGWPLERVLDGKVGPTGPRRGPRPRGVGRP